MDFTTITIDVLKFLSFNGNFGIGIILLTILVRVAMWPLGVSQQRSMRTMQILQPKMKAIQDRYKNDPQQMQQKMMEFYKEHKFNPMAGCFPLLIQMPIFILLYSALMSTQFIQMAGDSPFLFVQRLDATLQANAGVSNDGVIGVTRKITITAKNATVYLTDSNEPIKNVKISSIQTPSNIKADKPVDLRISLDDLDLKYSQIDKIAKAEVVVTVPQTRETETVTFKKQGDDLVANVPTKEIKNVFHTDVLLLIILFGLTMFGTQKIMMSTTKQQNQDPAQQAIQKSMNTFMPIMVTATFVFIPIPAGVLIYLLASNIFQMFQTVVINKQLELEDNKKKEKIDDDVVAKAKKVENKK